ncbi:MAG TPA: hypothetical protein VD994_21915 [Prosthecobacter sp.]|nr:hypothetical protein [Prosthecobacter sp.]
MTEFQEIQRLIRLKRFETPGEDFVEDFVNQFRERQRSELLRQSARGLLWERVNTYFEHLVAPKWAMAGATAVLCFLGTWGALSVIGTSSHDYHPLAALDTAERLTPAVQPSLEVNSPLMEAADEGQPIGIESVLISTQLDFGSDVTQFAGVDGGNASSANLLPVLDLR